VVGSEGRGLAPAIRRRCDLLVRIPMRGRIESLNAAVAGSVLVLESAAQREMDERTAAEGSPGPADASPEGPAGPDGAAEEQAPGTGIEDTGIEHA